MKLTLCLPLPLHCEILLISPHPQVKLLNCITLAGKGCCSVCGAAAATGIAMEHAKKNIEYNILIQKTGHPKF